MQRINIDQNYLSVSGRFPLKKSSIILGLQSHMKVSSIEIFQNLILFVFNWFVQKFFWLSDIFFSNVEIEHNSLNLCQQIKWIVETKGINTPSVKRQRQWQRQSPIGIHCDTSKWVPDPLPSVMASGKTSKLPLTLDAWRSAWRSVWV